MGFFSRTVVSPRLAISRAVSFPMPVLAPVMRTVFPSSLALLRHTPPASHRRKASTLAPDREENVDLRWHFVLYVLLWLHRPCAVFCIFFRLFCMRHEKLCWKKIHLQKNKILNWTPDKDVSDITLAPKNKKYIYTKISSLHSADSNRYSTDTYNMSSSSSHNKCICHIVDSITYILYTAYIIYTLYIICRVI